jgi:uncharacterized protein (UPF0264 family)
MKLLISVATAEEIPAALQGGADIIDIKNPAEGALGANFPHVIRQAVAATPPPIPVSAAIGDVPNLPGMVSLAALGAATCGVDFVKAGLYGVRTASDAVNLLQAVCKAVRTCDPGIRIIATAYADARHFNALPPLDLPQAAADAGVDGCLLDTAGKETGSLLTNLTENQIFDFVSQCRANRLLSALAGSLQAKDIDRIRPLGADIIGFRTAACRDGYRRGVIDALRVKHLKALIDPRKSPSSSRWKAASQPDGVSDR